MEKTFKQNSANYHRYTSVMCNAHYDMAESYRIHHRRFGIAVVVATAIVGTTTFGSLAKLTYPEWEVWTKFGSGLLMVAATVLSALQTFLGYPDLQAKHKHAADGYGVTRREIDLLVMKYPNATGAADEKATIALEKIKKLLDELDVGSPTIPDSVYDVASAKTLNESGNTGG